MSYKLFLDDLRTVDMVYKHLSDADFVIVRTFQDFVACIKQNGLPLFISFDNDLGEDSAGNLQEDGMAMQLPNGWYMKAD